MDYVSDLELKALKVMVRKDVEKYSAERDLKVAEQNLIATAQVLDYYLIASAGKATSIEAVSVARNGEFVAMSCVIEDKSFRVITGNLDTALSGVMDILDAVKGYRAAERGNFEVAA